VAATAGNPFLVTEMLASPNADVRTIVAHAVRPRPARVLVVATLRRQPSTAESTEQIERRLLSAPDLLHT
jgi:hypothetical protein